MRLLNFSKLLSLIFCAFAVATAGQTPIFADIGPPIRTGLWVTQRCPRDTNELNRVAAGLAKNHNLSGVCLHFFWNDLEKEPGKPDFSMLDKTVAEFRRLGMKYELGFGPGAHTPKWVYDQGAKAITTQVPNPHRADYGQTIEIPVPWDPIYQREFSRMIAQLGERYGQDPLCVSVVLSCANAVSGEMHLTKTREDLAKWQAMGDYEGMLLDVYKKYTDEWAKAFPRQAISLHLAKVLDLPPSFCERVVDYGLSKYPGRFTIQNCQLTGLKEDTGVMTYDLIQKYRDRAHHGFQNLAGISRPSERMGSIEMAALNVVHAGGEYWELWQGDGISVETSGAVLRIWEEAKSLGYEAYKKKLISEGKYQQHHERPHNNVGNR
jgi:hypothetical protein